jgi:hypothetical protein
MVTLLGDSLSNQELAAAAFLTNIYRSPGFYQVQQVNHFLFQGMAQPCPFSRA